MTSFEVAEAGCESCKELVAEALGAMATVVEIEIDEAADTASVTLDGDVARAAVDTALARASADAGGHVYRVREGSWSSPSS